MSILLLMIVQDFHASFKRYIYSLYIYGLVVIVVPVDKWITLWMNVKPPEMGFQPI
jgi:hypothetical protein